MTEVEGENINIIHDIFGVIFLIIFIVSYIISGIKAVKDRRAIKARLAAKTAGSNNSLDTTPKKIKKINLLIVHDKSREWRLKGHNIHIQAPSHKNSSHDSSPTNPSQFAERKDEYVPASTEPKKLSNVDHPQSHSTSRGCSLQTSITPKTSSHESLKMPHKLSKRSNVSGQVVPKASKQSTSSKQTKTGSHDSPASGSSVNSDVNVSQSALPTVATASDNSAIGLTSVSLYC